MAFPIEIPCSVKHLKIRILCKINKSAFISNIAQAGLIKAPHKTASLLTHQCFYTYGEEITLPCFAIGFESQ